MVILERAKFRLITHTNTPPSLLYKIRVSCETSRIQLFTVKVLFVFEKKKS